MSDPFKDAMNFIQPSERDCLTTICLDIANEGIIRLTFEKGVHLSYTSACVDVARASKYLVRN